MGNTYYISDLHFGHRNIIKYENRPYSTVDEMDASLIAKWNGRVKDDDEVYILGDFSLSRSPERVRECFLRLNGRKILIRGNHDSTNLRSFMEELFKENIYDYTELYDALSGKLIVLSHYPMPFFNGAEHGNVHLYGHVHDMQQWKMIEEMRLNCEKTFFCPWRMYNVSACMPYMGFVPRTLEEIEEGARRMWKSESCVTNSKQS